VPRGTLVLGVSPAHRTMLAPTFDQVVRAVHSMTRERSQIIELRMGEATSRAWKTTCRRRRLFDYASGDQNVPRGTFSIPIA
jgi:tRNA A58 N-methylase Trm61